MKLFLLALGLIALPGAATAALDKTPPEAIQVVAEGQAPANEADARELAIADALRNAVENTLGVYVDSQKLAGDYKVLQNNIVMKSTGFAVLDSVESSQTRNGILTVKVRASVRPVPLAERLREMGVLREWKIALRSTSKPESAGTAVQQALEDRLTKSGFSVVHEGLSDIEVELTGQAQNLDHSVDGGITFYRTRGAVEVSAYYPDTRDIITTGSAEAEALDQTPALAAKAALLKASEKLADELAAGLIAAPASSERSISLRIGGVGALETASALQKAVKSIPGVSRVTQQGLLNRTLHLDLVVKSEYKDLLPGKLESCATGKKLGLRILSWSKRAINASTVHR